MESVMSMYYDLFYFLNQTFSKINTQDETAVGLSVDWSLGLSVAIFHLAILVLFQNVKTIFN